MKRKDVLIVECKTTVTKNDIVNFARKVEIIKKKYEVVASAFGCRLTFMVWMFACYGWDTQPNSLRMRKARAFCSLILPKFQIGWNGLFTVRAWRREGMFCF